MNGEIRFVAGGLRNGKTRYVSEVMFEHLALGGYVFTNVEMRFGEIQEEMARQFFRVFDPSRLRILTNEETPQFHHYVAGGTADLPVMVVIDEAGLEFNARDHRLTDRVLLAFNTLVGKLDIILIYVSQAFHDTDKQFRSKGQTCTNCKHLAKFFPFSLFPKRWVPIFIHSHFDIVEGKLKRSNWEFAIGWPWTFRIYNSDALVGRVALHAGMVARLEGSPLEKIPRPPKRERLPAIVGGFLCGLFACL